MGGNMCYKTLDGFELNEGDECFVSVQCAEGLHHLSLKPRYAYYMSEEAKRHGVDFWIDETSRCDCEEQEVTHVWKNCLRTTL